MLRYLRQHNLCLIMCYGALLLSILGAVAHSLNYYGTSPSFHIIDLNCNGSEDTILNCSHNNITQHSCRWYEDAYVQCQSKNYNSCIFLIILYYS